MELQSSFVLEPVNTTGADNDHVLQLVLAPLGDLNQLYLPDPNASNYYAAGTVIFRPAFTTYRMITRAGRHRWFTVSIAPKHFPELEGAARLRNWKALADLKSVIIRGALMRLAQEAASPGLLSEHLVKSLSDTLIIDLARYFNDVQSNRDRTACGHLSKAQLNIVSEYVEALDDERPTAAGLAARLGMSRRHLTRLFRQTTGQTIHEHIADVRLRKALRLLEDRELSVKQISYKLGYAAPWGFATAFRAATGQSPTEFRQRLAVSDTNSGRRRSSVR